MKKEIPILFSTPMVQAVLEARKLMTRRTRGLNAVNANPDRWTPEGELFVGADGKLYQKFRCRNNYQDTVICQCPYGKVGDLLWVRETLYQEGELGLYYVADNKLIDEETIPLDYTPYRNYACCKVPNIHMQKSVARIWLEVTDIRVERLQEISPDDADLEGVERWNEDYFSEPGALHADYGNYLWKDDPKHEEYWFPSFPNPIDSFRSLWIKINGLESWNQNPWLWVVSFKVLSTTGKPKEVEACAS
jgi:hypothetical protein